MLISVCSSERKKNFYYLIERCVNFFLRNFSKIEEISGKACNLNLVSRVCLQNPGNNQIYKQKITNLSAKFGNILGHYCIGILIRLNFGYYDSEFLNC